MAPVVGHYNLISVKEAIGHGFRGRRRNDDLSRIQVFSPSHRVHQFALQVDESVYYLIIDFTR